MMNSFPVTVNERGYIRPCSYCNRVYVKPRASAGQARTPKAEIKRIENDLVCPRCSADTLLRLNPETPNVTPQATFEPAKFDSSRRRPGKKNKAGEGSGKVKVSASDFTDIGKGPKRSRTMSNLSKESVMPRKEEMKLLEYMANTFVKMKISVDGENEAPADVDLSLRL